MDESRYYDDRAVANNTMIVQKSHSCYYCRIVFYCYSNSSSSDVGYIRLPSNSLVYNDGSSYYWEVYRQSPSGMRVRNYYHYGPYSWGILTCEVPDSNGNSLEISAGVYSSMPSMYNIVTKKDSTHFLFCSYHTDAPHVYRSGYTDLSENNSDTTLNLLGTIICSTRYSPPTNVTWERDGVTVSVDGEKYEMIQTVTDRSNSYYDNILLIRDAIGLAGNHTYTCDISNYAGSTSQDISTNMTGSSH